MQHYSELSKASKLIDFAERLKKDKSFALEYSQKLN